MGRAGSAWGGAPRVELARKVRWSIGARERGWWRRGSAGAPTSRVQGVGDAVEPLGQGLAGAGEREAQVGRRAEGLARHHRHARLVEQVANERQRLLLAGREV